VLHLSEGQLGQYFKFCMDLMKAALKTLLHKAICEAISRL